MPLANKVAKSQKVAGYARLSELPKVRKSHARQVWRSAPARMSADPGRFRNPKRY